MRRAEAAGGTGEAERADPWPRDGEIEMAAEGDEGRAGLNDGGVFEGGCGECCCRCCFCSKS